ncbi:MAG: cadherin-like domain-containing protein [Reichenbachiella sp.]
MIASVNEDEFVDIVLVGTDDENNTLAWTFVDDANGAAIMSGTGNTKTIRYTPPTDFNGIESVVVRLSDADFDVSISLDFTINPVADPTDYSGTPIITGTLDVGETLTITPGTCTDPDAAVSWSYQWFRDDNASPGGGTNIVGATSISYDLVSDDNNQWLYAEVICNAEVKTTAHTASAINGNDEYLPGTGIPTNVLISSKALFNIDGGTLCWSDADMTGKTTASIRYSNGEDTGDQLLLKVGAVVIASFNTDKCLAGGAWDGDCATLIQSIIPTQTGNQTICLEAHNASGLYSGAITWLKLD